MMSTGMEMESREYRGVLFFGKVSASISHEIKNVLAVMAECSGLMDDLCLMSRQRGMPLDVERLQSLIGRIHNQVGRADQIVKNMNRFAHTVDVEVSTVQLEDHLQLLIALSNRLATMRGVAVHFAPEEVRLTLTTSPFLLQLLLWSCLELSMSVCGAGKRIEVRTEEDPKSVRISFSGLDDLTAWPSEAFPVKRLEELPTRELQARIGADVEGRALLIELPKSISKE